LLLAELEQALVREQAHLLAQAQPPQSLAMAGLPKARSIGSAGSIQPNYYTRHWQAAQWQSRAVYGFW